MRLAGFPHQKQPAQPFLVQVHAQETLPSYPDADFQGALANAEVKCSPSHSNRPAVALAIIEAISAPPDMNQGYPDGQRTRELTRRAGWCLGPAGSMTETEAVEMCLTWNQYNTPPLSE